MKLLIDQNISFKICKLLADLDSEITHVRQVSLEESLDGEIWTFAKFGKFTIVTMDADFAELAAVHGSPPKVVWLRIGNQPTQIVSQKLRSAWTTIQEFEESDNSVLEIY